jgi:hypothetical protein
MLAAPVPEIHGHAVSRITLSDADDWASFAALPRMQEHTSTLFSSVADLLPMIERSLSADPDAPVLFAVQPRSPRSDTQPATPADVQRPTAPIAQPPMGAPRMAAAPARKTRAVASPGSPVCVLRKIDNRLKALKRAGQ